MKYMIIKHLEPFYEENLIFYQLIILIFSSWFKLISHMKPAFIYFIFPNNNYPILPFIVILRYEIQTLKRVTGLSNTSDLWTLMEDRDECHIAIRDSRVGVGWRPHIAWHRKVMLPWTCNISRTSVGNIIVDDSDVVGAAPTEVLEIWQYCWFGCFQFIHWLTALASVTIKWYV